MVTHEISEDLLVVSTFKNLRLFLAIGDRTQAQVAEEAGVKAQDISDLLNLRRWPFRKDGNYSETTERISTWCGIPPEDLFPVALYSMRLPNKCLRAYDSASILPLLAASSQQTLSEDEVIARIDRQLASPAIRDALRALTPCQEEVIKQRFGLEGEDKATLVEVGQGLGVSSSRAGQIEQRALRRLRHPGLLRLSQFLPERNGAIICEGCHKLKVCGRSAKVFKAGAYMRDRLRLCSSCAVILDAWLKEPVPDMVEWLELREEAERLVREHGEAKKKLAIKESRQRRAARKRGGRDFLDGFSVRETNADYLDAYLDERRKAKEDGEEAAGVAS